MDQRNCNRVMDYLKNSSDLKDPLKFSQTYSNNSVRLLKLAKPFSSEELQFMISKNRIDFQRPLETLTLNNMSSCFYAFLSEKPRKLAKLFMPSLTIEYVRLLKKEGPQNLAFTSVMNKVFVELFEFEIDQACFIESGSRRVGRFFELERTQYDVIIKGKIHYFEIFWAKNLNKTDWQSLKNELESARAIQRQLNCCLKEDKLFEIETKTLKEDQGKLRVVFLLKGNADCAHFSVSQVFQKFPKRLLDNSEFFEKLFREFGTKIAHYCLDFEMSSFERMQKQGLLNPISIASYFVTVFDELADRVIRLNMIDKTTATGILKKLSQCKSDANFSELLKRNQLSCVPWVNCIEDIKIEVLQSHSFDSGQINDVQGIQVHLTNYEPRVWPRVLFYTSFFDCLKNGSKNARMKALDTSLFREEVEKAIRITAESFWECFESQWQDGDFKTNGTDPLILSRVVFVCENLLLELKQEANCACFARRTFSLAHVNEDHICERCRKVKSWLLEILRTEFFTSSEKRLMNTEKRARPESGEALFIPQKRYFVPTTNQFSEKTRHTATFNVKPWMTNPIPSKFDSEVIFTKTENLDSIEKHWRNKLNMNFKLEEEKQESQKKGIQVELIKKEDVKKDEKFMQTKFCEYFKGTKR
jgi:hypothetical protein